VFRRAGEYLRPIQLAKSISDQVCNIAKAGKIYSFDPSVSDKPIFHICADGFNTIFESLLCAPV